jgi:ABC-type lipoprotein export system ATPase subunit
MKNQNNINPEPVIRTEGVGKSYPLGSHELVVLRDVDLTINAGEFVTIVSPSGVGKSTLLHIVGAWSVRRREKHVTAYCRRVRSRHAGNGTD